MFKALFWFVIGAGATLVFFAAMLFLFGQTNEIACRHQAARLASCRVSNLLLGTAPLPGWQLDGVAGAIVESDCNDGCTYRAALQTAKGAQRPISTVWTDDRAGQDALAAQINAFVGSAEAPALVIDNAPAAWVIWLLAGLAGMSILIQALALFGQVARALFRSRSAAGRAWR